MSIARQARLIEATKPEPFPGANYAAAIGRIGAELIFADAEPAETLERIRAHVAAAGHPQTQGAK